MSVDSRQVDERAVFAAVDDVIKAVLDFDDETRRRIFRTAETFFFDNDFKPSFKPAAGSMPESRTLQSTRTTHFESSEVPSPKEFLFQKQPSTNVERVACLAYYLTHYRDTPHFKTIDISLLNTEAAQSKFSNAAYAVANAVEAALLVAAGKGAKQLSALGERFVDALPDRDAAKQVLVSPRARRRRKKAKNSQEAGSS